MQESSKDYLDELIELSIQQDSSFAEEWQKEIRAIKLATMRVTAGLSQSQLASKMGVRRERVAYIEANPEKTPFEVLAKYVAGVGGRIEITSPEGGNPISKKPGRPISSKHDRRIA